MSIKKSSIAILGVLLSAVLCFLFLQSGEAFAATYDSVYLGGEAIGVIQKCDGLVVASYADVETENGRYSPAKNGGVLQGDVIAKINGKETSEANDISKLISGATCSLTVLRGTGEQTLSVTPAYDIVAHEFKLGLTVKNEMAGIGTMTYILPDGRFGAVGHKIFDPAISYPEAFSKGKMYNCRIVGIEKGSTGRAGLLKGSFSKNDQVVGSVLLNTFCGLFGSCDCDFTDKTLIETGSRDSVKVGEASIYTVTEGVSPEKYSIEIIKTVKQDRPTDKSMIIRVTDQRLLEKTGGIVQGMSGSPIVQDGKLIGAVTHVFINDSTIGYGIYLDWMLLKN